MAAEIAAHEYDHVAYFNNKIAQAGVVAPAKPQVRITQVASTRHHMRADVILEVWVSMTCKPRIFTGFLCAKPSYCQPCLCGSQTRLYL